MGENDETIAGKSGTPDIRWLIAGALAGLLAAGFGILRQADSGNELPANAVARVNGQIISRNNYDRALARLGTNSTSVDKTAWVLQRLVEDELLVQRGLELGMAQSDSAVRNAIIDSLIASVTAEADAASPGDEELQQYLSDNADRFSYTASLSVAAWQTNDDAVAQSFVAKLRNGSNVTTSDAIGPIPDLPPGLMPLELLRDYLGPGVAAAAADMPVGSSAVFARRGRWLVVQVLEKKSAVVTDLGTIRNRVLLDYRRSLADQTLQDYLDDLRRRADLVVAQP
ncbi:MAG: peptidyl-prolyl cis-trans isomerase [Proteobacteria bacterium]|nr:peptidyl-prolyl cis-trans isomerase [Pseudomonadota bacterium]